MATYQTALAVQRKIKDQYLQFSGLHGISLGKREGQEEWTIYFHVIKKLPLEQVAEKERIPKIIDGVPTKVIEHEPMKPLVDDKKYRPVQGGCQIETKAGLGTLGCFLKRSDDNSKTYFLTNQHVLSSGIASQATKRRGGEIGEHLESKLTKQVDGAIGVLEEGITVDPNIIVIGEIKGTYTVTEKDIDKKPYKVLKYGRTTSCTWGQLTNIHYAGRRTDGWLFEDQYFITAGSSPFSDKGDSGSVVLNEDRKVIALLWGDGIGHSTASPIQMVLDTFSTSSYQYNIMQTITKAAVETVPSSPSVSNTAISSASFSSSSSSSSSSAPKQPNIQIFNRSNETSLTTALFIFDTDAPVAWQTAVIKKNNSAPIYTPDDFAIVAKFPEEKQANATYKVQNEEDLFTVSRQGNTPKLTIDDNINGDPDEDQLYVVVKRSVGHLTQVGLSKNNKLFTEWLDTSPGDTQVISFPKKFYLAVVEDDVVEGTPLNPSSLLTPLVEMEAGQFGIIEDNQSNKYQIKVSNVAPPSVTNSIGSTETTINNLTQSSSSSSTPAIVPVIGSGKITLHEYAFNMANTKEYPYQTLAFSPITSCLSVTLICEDGAIVGGHCVMMPFSFWYIISNLAKLVGSRKVSHVCVVGSDVWLNTQNLQAIAQGTDSNFFVSPAENQESMVKNEKLAISHILSNSLEQAIRGILTNTGAMKYFQHFSGDALNVSCTAEVDKAVLIVNQNTYEFDYNQ